MSRVKMFVPGTYVFGASVVLNHDPKLNRIMPVTATETMRQKGHGDVPYVRRGDVMWRKPKPMAFVEHFKNEAAKRRCNGDLKQATPNDLKVVPLYRGLSARVATEARARLRRAKEREAKMSLADKTKAALASLGLSSPAPNAA